MIVDPEQLPWRDVYSLLTQIVQPRPIAFVSTVSGAGQVNLAPFSFYNAVSGNPPVVVFSPLLNRDGSPKHTLANVRETGEFVVATVTEAIAAQMNECSAECPPHVCEFEYAGFTRRPAMLVRPPLVAESPVNLECRLLQIVPIGEEPGAGSLVIGRVLQIHVADDVLTEGGVDPAKLRAVGRMGGTLYARTDSVFSMERPTYAPR